MRNRRLILAGGSGFLGQVLARHFLAQGREVVVLTRKPEVRRDTVRQIRWDGETLGDWARELEGAEALINLAGRSVNCRYHQRNRKQMLDSRVHSTRVLGEAVARCANPPCVWLNSSTATIYRHTFGPPWDESGEIGSAPEAKDAFSIEVACAWEKAFNDARAPATRKVLLRSAMVLGHGRNSVFPALLRLVRCGLGGSLAGGRQFASWIHQADFCRAIDWLLQRRDISGPVNLAAPHPVTNAQLMRTLRQVCRVPLGIPTPLWLLEIGAFFLRTESELIIKSRRVVPGRLLASGFEFRFPEIESALRDLAGDGESGLNSPGPPSLSDAGKECARSCAGNPARSSSGAWGRR